MIEYYRWKDGQWTKTTRTQYEVRRGMALLDPNREERLAFYDTSGISLDVGAARKVRLEQDETGWWGLKYVESGAWAVRNSLPYEKAIVRLAEYAEQHNLEIVS